MTPRELVAVAILWRSATARARAAAVRAVPELSVLDENESKISVVLDFSKKPGANDDDKTRRFR